MPDASADRRAFTGPGFNEEEERASLDQAAHAVRVTRLDDHARAIVFSHEWENMRAGVRSIPLVYHGVGTDPAARTGPASDFDDVDEPDIYPPADTSEWTPPTEVCQGRVAAIQNDNRRVDPSWLGVSNYVVGAPGTNPAQGESCEGYCQDLNPDCIDPLTGRADYDCGPFQVCFDHCSMSLHGGVSCLPTDFHQAFEEYTRDWPIGCLGSPFDCDTAAFCVRQYALPNRSLVRNRMAPPVCTFESTVGPGSLLRPDASELLRQWTHESWAVLYQSLDLVKTTLECLIPRYAQSDLEDRRERLYRLIRGDPDRRVTQDAAGCEDPVLGCFSTDQIYIVPDRRRPTLGMATVTTRPRRIVWNMDNSVISGVLGLYSNPPSSDHRTCAILWYSGIIFHELLHVAEFPIPTSHDSGWERSHGCDEVYVAPYVLQFLLNKRYGPSACTKTHQDPYGWNTSELFNQAFWAAVKSSLPVID